MGGASNLPQRKRSNFTPVTFQMIREGNATPDDCVELDGAVIKEVSAYSLKIKATANLYSVKILKRGLVSYSHVCQNTHIFAL